MTPALRQRLLFVALAASLGATAWVASNEEAPASAPPAKRPARTVPGQAPATGEVATRTERTARAPWPVADATARLAWGAPPPSRPAPVGAPHRVAAAEPDEPPPMPFAYQLVGRMTDTRTRVILTNAQRSLVLGVGEVIDGQWRIDAIEPTGIRVSTVPGGSSQFIPFPTS